MKRYDLESLAYQIADDILDLLPDGIYPIEAMTECVLGYLKEHEREMIPRPDKDAARKAVDTLLAEVMWMYEYKHNGHDDLVESQQDKVLDARAAVLKLMGVE